MEQEGACHTRLGTSVRVEATGYSTIDGVVEYMFDVSNDDEKWTLSYPASAFEELHEQLGGSEALGVDLDSGVLPWLDSSDDTMSKLEAYLDSLLENMHASRSTVLREFLDIYGDTGEPPGRDVTLIKARGLGLVLEELPDSHPYAVVVRSFASLEDGSKGPAESSGLIQVRDVVVVVGWSDMWQRPYEEVIERMQTAPDPVTLRVCGSDALTSFIGQRAQIEAEAEEEAVMEESSIVGVTSGAGSDIPNDSGPPAPLVVLVEEHEWYTGVLHATVHSAQSLSLLSTNSSLGSHLAQGLLNLTGGAKGHGQGAAPQGLHRCYFKARIVLFCRSPPRRMAQGAGADARGAVVVDEEELASSLPHTSASCVCGTYAGEGVQAYPVWSEAQHDSHFAFALQRWRDTAHTEKLARTHHAHGADSGARLHAKILLEVWGHESPLFPRDTLLGKCVLELPMAEAAEAAEAAAAGVANEHAHADEAKAEAEADQPHLAMLSSAGWDCALGLDSGGLVQVNVRWGRHEHPRVAEAREAAGRAAVEVAEAEAGVVAGAIATATAAAAAEAGAQTQHHSQQQRAARGEAAAAAAAEATAAVAATVAGTGTGTGTGTGVSRSSTIVAGAAGVGLVAGAVIGGPITAVAGAAYAASYGATYVMAAGGGDEENDAVGGSAGNGVAGGRAHRNGSTGSSSGSTGSSSGSAYSSQGVGNGNGDGTGAGIVVAQGGGRGMSERLSMFTRRVSRMADGILGDVTSSDGTGSSSSSSRSGGGGGAGSSGQGQGQGASSSMKNGMRSIGISTSSASMPPWTEAGLLVVEVSRARKLCDVSLGVFGHDPYILAQLLPQHASSVDSRSSACPGGGINPVWSTQQRNRLSFVLGTAWSKDSPGGHGAAGGSAGGGDAGSESSPQVSARQSVARSSGVLVQLWDENVATPDELIGSALIPLPATKQGLGKVCWHPVNSGGEVECRLLHFDAKERQSLVSRGILLA